jgi:putative transcriptional regulator
MENLTGQFLIAMPNLNDGIFHHAVVYICSHNEEGAMGIIVNRPLGNLKLDEIFKNLEIESKNESIFKVPIFNGGPVQTQNGFIIHTPHENWDAMLTISNKNEVISVSNSLDILKSIANGEGSKKFLITLGYSGWVAGQLEHELAENSWLNIPADSSIIFDTPINKRWHTAATSLGIDLNLISNQAGKC